MMLDWTRGEVATIAFVFALIYGAAWVMPFGRWVARALGGSPPGRPPGGSGAGGGGGQ